MADISAPPRRDDLEARTGVPRPLAIAGAWSWRLAAVGLVVAGVVWLLGQALVVVVPVAIAALLARGLWPVASRIDGSGRRRGRAAALTMVGFLIAVTGALAFVGWAVAGEADQLGATLSEGLDDVETWLVDDSPFDVSPADVDRWREQAGDAVATFVRSNEGSAVSGALLVGELVIGVLLALIVTFFFLKDGRGMVEGALRQVPAERRDVARRAADRAWDAAGGYLRGAAVLGIVEAVAIGAALLVVGADLVVAVMLVTFLGAFVPIVGATAAGIVAVLVALVTAGTVPALVVAAVALVVQQLDNDLLAPVIYGKALRLHPLVILLGIAAGGALFGFVGTVFAVPVLAVALNALGELRRPEGV